MNSIPDKIKMRVTSFFAIKVDGKYWMEEFPPHRSDVSEKGFTDDLFRAYRIEREATLTQMKQHPVTYYLRPDFAVWYPELNRGEIVELKLIESIAEGTI